MKGRALTPTQKREVIEDILAAWLMLPELRLGQLLHAVEEVPLFYIEDETLGAKALELALDILAREET